MGNRPLITQLRTSERGDTLIEVLVSLGVLVIGVFSIVALLTNQLRFNRQLLETMTSALLAEEGMEIVRSERDALIWSSAASPFLPNGLWCHDLVETPVTTGCKRTELRRDQNGLFTYQNIPSTSSSGYVRWAEISCTNPVGPNFTGQRVKIFVRGPSGTQTELETEFTNWSNPGVYCL